MSLEDQSAILPKRILGSHKNWQFLFSVLLIRNKKLSFLTQTLHTNFETSAKTNGTQELNIKYKFN